jgi:acyl-CoA synthetase (AMP-forming)/AMP-acid ligase II
MDALANLAESIAAHARIQPARVAIRDSQRSCTYRDIDERSKRLANALLGLGLKPGDRVAVLAYNRAEWLELYTAMAWSGLVIVPINFRLTALEMQYIIDDAGVRAVIVQDALRDRLEPVRADLAVPECNYLLLGANTDCTGYLDYEEALAGCSTHHPNVEVQPDDPWAFMYTSGTTGKPKGAIRSHDSVVKLALITALDEGFTRDDTGLLVMPLCHSNSFWYIVLLAYLGATTVVYDRQHFEPEALLRILSEERVTFTSLVPTHYINMYSLPASVRDRSRAGDVARLKISSAPARMDTKLAILEQFPTSQLLEGYGSTECGWVTLLRPREQLEKLGSIGRELTGSAPVRLLDADGREVPDGDVGELFSYTPYTFGGYWNLPEKSTAAFRGAWCSVGDMARRDEDGFYYLVDRKSNMIISGGENVYPSEVESVLGAHPHVRDMAVIGIADVVWGESVCAVVVLRDSAELTEAELIDWCRGRIAGFKRPKSVIFIRDEEMPRTATGKIQHRLLRDRFQN